MYLKVCSRLRGEVEGQVCSEALSRVGTLDAVGREQVRAGSLTNS